MRDRTNQRPRLDIPRTFGDYIGEILSLTGVFAGLVMLAMIWTELPGQIPRHFGFTGEPTAWSGRWSAIFPIGLAVAFYIGLTLMGRVPHAFNYAIQITEKNAPVQYRLARSMVIWLKALLVWMMVVIVWSQARVALGDADGMNPILIGGFLIGVHVVLGVFLYRSYRWRDGLPQDDETNVWNRS